MLLQNLKRISVLLAMLLLSPSRGFNWYHLGYNDPNGCDTIATSFDHDYKVNDSMANDAEKYPDSSIVIGGTTKSTKMLNWSHNRSSTLGKYQNNQGCLPRPVPFIHFATPRYVTFTSDSNKGNTMMFGHRLSSDG